MNPERLPPHASAPAAAQVAHKIHGPIGFVDSNLRCMERYVRDLMRLLQAYETRAGLLPEDARAAIERLACDIDHDYLREDLAALINESQEGLDHIRRIVADLEAGPRPDPPA